MLNAKLEDSAVICFSVMLITDGHTHTHAHRPTAKIGIIGIRGLQNNPSKSPSKIWSKPTFSLLVRAQWNVKRLYGKRKLKRIILDGLNVVTWTVTGIDILKSNWNIHDILIWGVSIIT